jgi:hypothetical protein
MPRRLVAVVPTAHTPAMPEPADPPSDRSRLVADSDLATQILVAGAAMVGVSLTLMGLIRIVQSLQSVSGLVDNLLAAAAIVFLFACLAAYLALRATAASLAGRWLRFADILFIAGLVAMLGIGVLLAVELL